MAIRLRGTGRGFTDRVPGLWGESADEVFPSTWMPAASHAARTPGTLGLPRARAPAGAINRADVALYASLAAHSHSKPAGPHQTPAAAPQGAVLAAWEDEGGAPASPK